MRMLNNGTVEEDVEYYIESFQDPGFEDKVFLYDVMDLQDVANLVMKQCYNQLRLLEAATMHTPLPSEPPKPCIKQTPMIVPSYYPQGLPNCATESFFTKLFAESFFFAFYHMEGPKALYLSAKASKKSMRFHIKNKTWYLRYEDLNVITLEC
ncbi:hypothetical protein HPB48_003770 [Haemaphysalis longicornis]|uniref:NOT2/NOT3/NOT5 C-terminal domain-containing protein n=1 Tax=Haemaphysalis longicornis TaxID=44386 RepID=A0A9J6FFR4_HAELO|nr:hypothetical protein HPB48_003770 [Haemaphysalis longicornis]